MQDSTGRKSNIRRLIDAVWLGADRRAPTVRLRPMVCIKYREVIETDSQPCNGIPEPHLDHKLTGESGIYKKAYL